jgi:Tol biopolymer transport system component
MSVFVGASETTSHSFYTVVWVYNPQRDAITRVTFGGRNAGPVWSPDRCPMPAA